MTLSAALYLLLGLTALCMPLYLVGWAEHGSGVAVVASGKETLALLCVAVVCLALSLLRTFSLLCGIRTAQARIAKQNAELERQGVELETRNEELQAQQVELEHTANNLIGTNILLLQSSRRFQELFQGVPIACYCYDERGRIIEWNRACEALYGFPTDEIFEKYIWDTICGPTEAERAREIVLRVFAGESFEGIEWGNLRADGSECRVLCNTFPLRAHDGKILGAISANIDITERAAALDLLAENEERYRRLVEHTPDAIAVHRGGKVVYINPAGLRLFGAVKPAEILGKSLRNFEHEPSAQSSGWWMLQSGEESSGEPVQAKIERIDGKTIDIEATAIPINYKGSPSLQLVIRDISARRQAEDLLHQQSAAMQASMDGCAILDQQGLYIYVNQAHASIHGYESGQVLLGKSWKMLYPADELARFEEEIIPAVIRDGRWRGEATGQRADGSIFRQEVSLTRIEGAGLACVVRDITERKQAEEKLKYIMAGARCLLWVGTVTETEAGMAWNLSMPDEEAARRFLPLDVEQGQPYAQAWRESRVEEDRARTDAYGADCTRQSRGYSQEFRIRRIDGEIRWLAEEVAVEPIAPGTWRAVGVCTDITERKKAEEKLKYITTGARCLLWDAVVVDNGGERLDWDTRMTDEQASQRFLPLDIAPNQSYADALYFSRLDDDRERCDQTSEVAVRSGQSYSQEFRCRRADGEIRWLAEDVSVEPLGHDRWRAVGVCLDITDRKRAESISRSVTDAALCLLWEAEIVDEGGEKFNWYLSMNDEAAAQRFLPLEIGAGETYVDAWYLSRLDDDRRRCDETSMAALRSGQSYSQEFRCRRADGEIRWLAEDVAVEPIGPNRWRAVGVALDITERKRAEELSKSVANAARCLLWEAEIFDPLNGEKLVWAFRISEEAAQRFLPLEIEPGKTYNDAWYKSRIEGERERCDIFGDENIRGGRGYSQEFRCRRADGEIRWLAEDVAVEPLGPNRWRAVGVCLDVTERKRAEEMSKSVVNAARCLLWEAEVKMAEGKLKWEFHLTDEEAAQRFLPLEIEPGFTYNDAWYRSRLEEDRDRADRMASEKILANQSYTQEFRCRRADGEIRWLAEDVAIEALGPDRWRAVGVCLDVTERKRAEEISHFIVDSARCLFWEATVEYDGEHMIWDLRMTDEEAARRFLPLNVKPGEAYHEAWHEARLPEDRFRINQYGTAKILANQGYSQEYRCRRSDGEIRWLAEDVAVEPIGPNKWRAAGICTDITERKRAEEMSRSIVEAGRCLLWEAEVRLVDGILKWEFHLTDEEAAQRFLALEVRPGDRYHDAWYHARLEEDQARMKRYCREKILADQSYSQEFRCRRADGEIRWMAEDVAVEPLGHDRWRAVGVCLDITERKRAEEMSRSIIDAARCLLWECEIVEIDGQLKWNVAIFDEEAAQRFLPVRVEEGQRYSEAWNLSRHPDDRKRIDFHADSMVRAGKSYSQEFRCIREDGEIRWLTEDVAVEEIAAGRWRAVGVCIDITERKRAEEISRSIVDAARCLLWEASVELTDGLLVWNLRMTNEEAAQRFLPVERMPEESYTDAWHRSRLEEDVKRLNDYAFEMISSNKSYSQEFRCRRFDGEIRWLAEEVVIEPQGPDKWHAVGVCVDVTERKRAEERLRYIMASAHCLFWDAVVTDQGGALTWDIRISDEDAAQRLLPLYVPKGRTYASAWINSRLEEDHIRMADLAAAEIRAGRGYSQEFRCRRRDGEIRWLAEDVSVEPLGPGCWLAVGVCLDITERKNAENVLRDDIQRFSSIIATQYDIVKAKLDLNKLLSLTVERVQKLTGAASAAIGLMDDGGIAWRARRSRRTIKGGDSLDALFAERCVKSGEIVYCPDLKAAAQLDRNLATDLPVRSIIAVPLHHNQAVTGVLIVHANETYAFGERNMQTLQLMAGLISTAVEHAAEFEEKQALLSERTSALTALQDSEARFKAFMDNTPAVAFMKDAQGRRVWANKTWQQRFKRTEAEFVGTTDFELYPQEIALKIQENDQSVLKANKVVESRELVPTPSEGMRHWWSFKFPFQDRTGQRFLGGVAFDVTEQKIAEDALRESEERFRLAINSIHEGLVLMDAEGRIQLFNQSAERILGQIAEQILVDQPFEPGWRMVGEDGKDFDENDRPIEMTLRTGQPQRDVVVGVEKPDSQIVWISFNTVPLFRQGDPKPYAAVASFTDITERRRVAQQLREQMQIIQKAHATLETQQAQLMEANTKLKALATLDGLTGLKNHRAFQEKLETEFQRATLNKKPLSLLLLDVDMFKLYNDTFGHLAGDEVLKTVARILRENARGNDFVARYGGEEFVVIVPRADRAKALAVAERFRKAIEGAPWPERLVTASFGVSTLDERITAPSTLIAEADRALYHAKANGRNRAIHMDDAGPDSAQSVLFRQWVEASDTTPLPDQSDDPPAQAA